MEKLRRDRAFLNDNRRDVVRFRASGMLGCVNLTEGLIEVDVV